MVKNGILGSKKGNAVFDTVLVLIVLFAFGIIIYFGNMIFNDFNTSLQADNSIDTQAKTEVADLNTKYPSLFDGIFIMVFILLWILVLIASYNIDSHPIFFIVTVIIMIFVFVLSANMSNTFVEITSDDSLSAVSMPMTDYIFNHFLQFIMVIGFTIIIVLYAKSR